MRHTEDTGRAHQVICHEVDLNVDDLAPAVAPCDDAGREGPPRHVVLHPAVLVTAQSTPASVDGVELHREPTAVQTVVVVVLDSRFTQTPTSSLKVVIFKTYRLQVTPGPHQWQRGSAGGLQPHRVARSLPAEGDKQQDGQQVRALNSHLDNFLC